MTTKRIDARSVPELIDLYCFPIEIANRAKQYYHEQRKLMEGKRNEGHKKNLAFYCVYQAHLLLRAPFLPPVLARTMNIDPSKIGKYLSKYTLSGYEPTIVRYTAIDFLPMFLREVGLTNEHLGFLTKIATRAYQLEPALEDSSPQKLAAGIINYYLETHKHKYDRELFAEKIEISATSIGSFSNLVSQLGC